MKNLTFVLALFATIFACVYSYPAQTQDRRVFPSGKSFIYTYTDGADYAYNGNECYLDVNNYVAVCKQYYNDNTEASLTIQFDKFKNSCNGKMRNVTLYKKVSKDLYKENNKICNLNKPDSTTLKKFVFQFDNGCTIEAPFRTKNMVSYYYGQRKNI